MSVSTMVRPDEPAQASWHVALRGLIGSGDKIGRFVLPFILVGLATSYFYPTAMSVGELSRGLRALSAAVLTVGVVVWAWSVVLILMKVPKRQLITTGPFALVKHPLYTGVALLVLPWLGFLLGTWLGAVIGAAMYAATRLYGPREEASLSAAFGAEWDEYSARVRMPWL